MSRDIRLAGYGIPPPPDNVTIYVTIPNNIIAAGVTSIRSLYAKDNTTGPDQIYILYSFDMDNNQRPTSLNIHNGLRGYEHLGVQGQRVLRQRADSRDRQHEYDRGPLSDQRNTGRHYNFAQQQQLQCAHPCSPRRGYLSSPPAMVAKARFVRYFIDATTDPAHPTLMVRADGERFAAAPRGRHRGHAVDVRARYEHTRRRNRRFMDSDPDVCPVGHGPPGSAAIHRADASSGSGVVGDAAGNRQPGRRNDAGRVSPTDVRHRDRCPEFGSVTG